MTYINADELRAMMDVVKVTGSLDGKTAERLIREHARLMTLSHDLIWVEMGCPNHKDYRGRGPKPPARDCNWCRSLWDFHQEHAKSKRFEDVMAEQTRRVNALLRRRKP